VNRDSFRENINSSIASFLQTQGGFMKLQSFLLAAVLLAIGGPWISNAKASELDKKTIVTLSEPMTIPGGTVLQPGEYVVRRADPSMPNVVQFLSADESRVYATAKGISTYRMEPAEGVILNTDERSGHNPEALKSWFYPGDNTGVEFIYPASDSWSTASRKDSRASNTLMASNTEPGVSSAQQSSTEPVAKGERIWPSPVKQDDGSSVGYRSENTEIAQAPASEPMSAQPATNPAPSTVPSQNSSTSSSASTSATSTQQDALPKTASPFPMIALGGSLLLALGLLLRKPVKQSS
jgi:hypothetical protein